MILPMAFSSQVFVAGLPRLIHVHTVCAVAPDAEPARVVPDCRDRLNTTAARFFIPDVEYLKDPQGLVAYVEAKIKLGNICPYCNGKGKTFHTYRALQQVKHDSRPILSYRPSIGLQPSIIT